VIDIIDKLNPHNEQSKIVLITRFGVNNVRKYLGPLIEAIQAR